MSYTMTLDCSQMSYAWMPEVFAFFDTADHPLPVLELFTQDSTTASLIAWIHFSARCGESVWKTIGGLLG